MAPMMYALPMTTTYTVVCGWFEFWISSINREGTLMSWHGLFRIAANAVWCLLLDSGVFVAWMWWSTIANVGNGYRILKTSSVLPKLIPCSRRPLRIGTLYDEASIYTTTEDKPWHRLWVTHLVVRLGLLWGPFDHVRGPKPGSCLREKEGRTLKSLSYLPWVRLPCWS